MVAEGIDRIAIVLFAYEEQGNLLRLLHGLREVIGEHLPDTEVQVAVCVQGTDGTLDEAHDFKREMAGRWRVSITHSKTPLGIREACTRSFALVEGAMDAYLMMDCDLNHRPEELPAFLEARRPSSVIVGSRYCTAGRIVGMPLWKRVLSSVFNRSISLLLVLPIGDMTSGFRLISGPAVADSARAVTGEGFEFYFEFLLLLWRRGFAVVEVPIRFTARTVGVSKMGIIGTIFGYLRSLARLQRLRWGRMPDLPPVTDDD